MEYASKGVANAGLTTGIIGTALGALGSGIIPNVLNGGAASVCSENTPVSRFELEQVQTIANKDMEIAYWRGQDETNRKISDTYANLESQIKAVASEVRTNKDEQNGINLQQAVYNGTNTAAIGCMQNQINQLLSLTKMVVPNSSVCPGWGTATVSVSTDTTTA